MRARNHARHHSAPTQSSCARVRGAARAEAERDSGKTTAVHKNTRKREVVMEKREAVMERNPVFLYSCIPVFQHSCIPIFLYSCIPVFPYSRIPVFQYSCIPVFRHSSIPVFLYSCMPAFLYSCIPVFLHSCIPVFLYAVFLYSCIPAFRYSSILVVSNSQQRLERFLSLRELCVPSQSYESVSRALLCTLSLYVATLCCTPLHSFNICCIREHSVSFCCILLHSYTRSFLSFALCHGGSLRPARRAGHTRTAHITLCWLLPRGPRCFAEAVQPCTARGKNSSIRGCRDGASNGCCKSGAGPTWIPRWRNFSSAMAFARLCVRHGCE